MADKSKDRVYVRLQQHLDRQAVGFPATKSGAEIRILKHIFTPREAEIAICLRYKPEPLETVRERAADLVGSPEELLSLLDEMEKRGGIETKIKSTGKHYCLPPFIVGLYEFQAGRLTSEFLDDVDEYVSNPKFGIEFLATELPQMRTIPVGRSIRPENHVSTYDRITELLQEMEGPFAVLECICRAKKQREGKPCKITKRNETCLATGHLAASIRMTGAGREITREEAMAIIERNQKEGLVLQPSNSEQPEFICSCCGCCCGILGIHKMLPKPLDFWAANFHAAVNADLCNGCGACAARCQVECIRADKKGEPAAIDLNRCIGCGLCVPLCPQKAMSLQEKPVAVRPPKSREELFEIIMANKKGRIGKLKLAGKLTLDTIRTGHKIRPANRKPAK